MTIAAQILAARLEMLPLVADETARIQGSKGAYQFKYVSLANLLSIVVPALGAQGVLLTQHVGSDAADPSTISVTTKLINSEGEHISSPSLSIRTDGSPKGIGGAITSLRRFQLYSLLGLPPDGEDESPQQQASPPKQPPPPPPPAASKEPAPTPSKDDWTKQEPLRKVVTFSLREDVDFYLTDPAIDLSRKMKEADQASDMAMPTEPSPGKSMSMYAYLASQIDQLLGGNRHGLVLSFLLGRVVTKETPPGNRCRFLIDDLEGYGPALIQVNNAIQEGPNK